MGPGASVLVPVQVYGHEPGTHLLEIDVVHEAVCWFGTGLRVPVRIEEPAAVSDPRSGARP